jgi:hypothetical protein
MSGSVYLTYISCSQNHMRGFVRFLSALEHSEISDLVLHSSLPSWPPNVTYVVQSALDSAPFSFIGAMTI